MIFIGVFKKNTLIKVMVNVVFETMFFKKISQDQINKKIISDMQREIDRLKKENQFLRAKFKYKLKLLKNLNVIKNKTKLNQTKIKHVN